MPQKIIKHDYLPREIFKGFHQRHQRWAIEVVHRRGGKTVATINDTISRILYFEPPISPVTGLRMPEPGRFAYIAPFLNQARQVAWDYVKRYSQGMLKKPPSEAELSVTYFNDAKLTLYGADNPDSLRGIYLDGADMDEYGMMKPSMWSEVVLPCLIDRGGWATFIGTPNGPNHFRDLVRAAALDPERWFLEIWPVSKTGLIPLEELEEMKRLMLPEEYLQEMECSFEASSRGAFYSLELLRAQAEGRFAALCADPNLPMNFVLDLGRTDDTAIIAFQEAPDAYPILDCFSDHMHDVQYYIDEMYKICERHGCALGRVFLPHDAKAKTLATRRSVVEQFLDANIRPLLVPSLDVLDGIAAARKLFPDIWFNTDGFKGPATKLVEALKTYRREWDEDKKAFKNKAIEDWSVHFADAFRYFALVVKKLAKSTVEVAPTQRILRAMTHYPITFDQLWEMHRGRDSGRIQ